MVWVLQEATCPTEPGDRPRRSLPALRLAVVLGVRWELPRLSIRLCPRRHRGHTVLISGATAVPLAAPEAAFSRDQKGHPRYARSRVGVGVSPGLLSRAAPVSASRSAATTPTSPLFPRPGEAPFLSLLFFSAAAILQILFYGLSLRGVLSGLCGIFKLIPVESISSWCRLPI